MRVFISIVVFAILNSYGWAQANNSHDGLVLSVSTANDAVFYYGEQIFFYFKVTNTKNSVNLYYTPSGNTNYRLILKNVTTGTVKESQRWLPHPRGEQQNQPPSEDRAYQPNETIIVQTLLNAIFADKKLTEQTSYSYKLAQKLLAIEPGKYHLTVEYQLLPSDAIISTSYNFEIKEVPSDQQEAFNQYVKATAYAGQSYRRGGGGNYSATHPDSYENFLQHFPNSLYSDYAFVDMVNEVYIYSGQTREASIEKFKQYIDYFSNLEKNSLKMYYITHLPFSMAHIPGSNLHSELDQFLKEKLVKENSDLSIALIDIAKWKYQIGGLTNYAKEAIPK